jgi:hypothetical protein
LAVDRSWVKRTQRHTSAEFVVFLADAVATQPEGKEIHVIADNLSAHKTKSVAEFLAAHTNVHMIGNWALRDGRGSFPSSFTQTIV